MRTIAIAVLLVGLTPVVAQVDEQTEDYERRDDKYFQRYQEQKEEPEPPEPAADEPDGPNTEAFIALAEELVRDKNYWSRNSERYRIQTDDPGLDSTATVELLEAFRTFFDGFWPEGTELAPYDEVSRVFLFDSFYKYNQLLGFDARFSDIRPKGHYISLFNVLVLRTTADTGGGLADTLVHEAAHQLIDQRLYGRGYGPSVWVSEGLASYFGYTMRGRSGAFEPGRIGGKNVALLKGGSTAATGEAMNRKGDYRKAVKAHASEDGPFIDAFLVSVSEPGAFYGPDLELNYTVAWVLTHYLLHGDDGAHREAFVRYIEAEAAGQGGREALYREIGMDAAELDAVLAAHVKKMK